MALTGLRVFHQELKLVLAHTLAEDTSLTCIDMKPEKIKNVLTYASKCPSKWELDNIVWHDRLTNPEALVQFLQRIETIRTKEDNTSDEKLELEYLLDLLDDMDEEECLGLLDTDEEVAKDVFIEDLARISAIQVLTNGKMDFDTMTTACKLSPNDFILCAKRTQDIINAIHGLVIKGETLSKDVAGA